MGQPSIFSMLPFLQNRQKFVMFPSTYSIQNDFRKGSQFIVSFSVFCLLNYVFYVQKLENVAQREQSDDEQA